MGGVLSIDSLQYSQNVWGDYWGWKSEKYAQHQLVSNLRPLAPDANPKDLQDPKSFLMDQKGIQNNEIVK
jgi:hypothetical protein